MREGDAGPWVVVDACGLAVAARVSEATDATAVLLSCGLAVTVVGPLCTIPEGAVPATVVSDTPVDEELGLPEVDPVEVDDELLEAELEVVRE